MLKPRIIALLLAFITLFSYLPATRFDFVNYDDDDYVTNNPIVKEGLTFAGIKWAFTTGHASNWHPLTWLSHMTDCEFFKLNAGGHHLVSVLFHSANAALLFILLLRLTGKIRPSAFVAALFAWHPLHVESVAWVAERKDVLSTCFALLALLSYVKFARENARGSLWLSVFFFALGLMAKPMLVTLPFMLLLLDFWPLKRFSDSAAKVSLFTEKMPFFLLSVGSCIITIIVQRGGHAIASLEHIPLAFRMENAPVAALRYLLKIVWPANLAVMYPLAPIPMATVAIAVVVLISSSVVAWRWRNVRPYFLFGWLWFIGTLIPVIGIIQVGSTSMADRYTYMPAVGIFIALAFAFNELAGKVQWAGKIFPAGAAIILGGCLLLTETQLGYWQNSETLFRHAIAVTQNNDVAHVDLGVVLSQQGRTDEALAEYREAARINPGRYQIRYNLGILLDKCGKPAEAVAEYYEAIRLDPGIATVHSAAGSALAELGKYDEAIKEFVAAETLDPNYAVPHLETARVLYLQGHDDGAVDELRAALRVEPDNFQVLAGAAHYLAANANASARDGRNALVLAIKANELTGHTQPTVFDVLGMAFAETGDFTSAQTCAQNALALATTAKMTDIESLQHRLALYQNHQPWHESFLTTNVSLIVNKP